MSSELIVDELTGRASAGSIAVTAEGGTVTTNLQQGLCKAVGTIDTDTDNSIDFSFNIASYTDRATGSLYGNFTNNMGSAIGYTVVGSASEVEPSTMGTTDSNRSISCSADTAARFSSNGFADSNNSMQDLNCHSNAVFGDLA